MDGTQHSFGEVVRVALFINRFEVDEEVAIIMCGFDEQRHDGIACDFGILFKRRGCVRELSFDGRILHGALVEFSLPAVVEPSRGVEICLVVVSRLGRGEKRGESALGLEKESGGGQIRRWKRRRRFPFIFKNSEVMQLAGRGWIVEEAQGLLHLCEQWKWIFLRANMLGCAMIPRADDGALRAGIVRETMDDGVRGGGVEPTAPMVEGVRSGAGEHADVVHADGELGVEVIAESDVTQRGIDLLVGVFWNGICADRLDTFDENLFESAHAFRKLIRVEGAVVIRPLREHEFVGHAARKSDIGINIVFVEAYERGSDGGMSARAEHFSGGGLIRVAEAADLPVAPRLLGDPFG